MKRYDAIVLNKLIDSYENSAAYAEEHCVAFRSAMLDNNDSESSSAAQLEKVGDENPSAAPLEKSDAENSRAASSRRRGVFCRIDKKNFPDYFNTASGAYEILHEQLQEMENKGLIRLYWKGGVKGHILEKAALNADSISDCYKYLRRTPRWKKESEILAICSDYRNKARDFLRCPDVSKISADSEINSGNAEINSVNTDEIAGNCQIDTMIRFLDWICLRLERGESVKRYADIDDTAGLDRTCRLLLSILTNDQDVYLRQFSIAVFNDSKATEKELERVISVIREFGKDPSGVSTDDYSGLNSDEILEAFGIFRNPVWLYMKGYAGIRICGGHSGEENSFGKHSGPEHSGSEISCVENSGLEHYSGETSCREYSDTAAISLLANGIGFTLHDLKHVSFDTETPPECVLTVENLTSYYQYSTLLNGKKALVIYLGGFAGRQKRNFLKMIRNTYPDAKYMHSGDIDCGGFRIWKSLCKGTGIPFETYNMDIDTYEHFFTKGRPLTAQDIKTLEMMQEDPFYTNQLSLFAKMLDTGIKLEQECFI